MKHVTDSSKITYPGIRESAVSKAKDFEAAEGAEPTKKELEEVEKEMPDIDGEDTEGISSVLTDQEDKYYRGIDMTQHFLMMAAKYPQLTAEQERELFHRYKDDGDREARERLILCNMKLGIKAAFYYYRKNAGNQIDDLISSSMEAITKAVDKFDLSKGCKFSTYATFWIRRDIIKQLETGGIVGSPATVSSQAVNHTRKVKKFTEAYFATYGKEPSIEEISASTGLSLKNVKRAIELAQAPVSIEQTMEESDESLETKLSMSEQEDPTFESAAQVLLCESMDKLYKDLTVREYDVIVRRFGLDGRKEEKPEEIAKDYHLTRERIRQIIKAALKKLYDNTSVELAGYLN